MDKAGQNQQRKICVVLSVCLFLLLFACFCSVGVYFPFQEERK